MTAALTPQRLELCRSRLEERLRALGRELQDGLHADERDAAQIARDAEELNGAVRALQRIKDGEYGVCLDCAAPISWQRLEAVPHAPRCAACQQAAERFRPRQASL